MKQGKILSCLAIVLAILTIIGCGETKPAHPDEFIISGKLKNSKGELLRLQILAVDSIGNIDSVNIDDEGTFSFRCDINEPMFYLLGTGGNNFITLLIDKGEDLSFEGDAMHLASNYKVTGSPGSVLLCDLNSYTRKNYLKSDSLLNVLNSNQAHARFDSIKHIVDSSYILLFDDQKKFVKEFIRKNSTSLASLVALYQVFGRMKVVNEKEDFELYELLGKNLGEKYPSNAYVTELIKRIDIIHKEQADRKAHEAKLDSGNVAPEINLNSAVGYPAKLSSFRNYVVLVYFWAGWSAPSQQVIPFYKALYKKYGPRGFTIFGVSLDKDRQTWEEAIRGNKLSWTQVSDLREWDSPVVKDYNITSIPVAFLIDRQGQILCKRPDQQTLANYLYRMYKF